MRLHALLATALAVGSLAVAAPASSAAVPRCHGEPATVVGHGQQSLRGTAGRDVIVTGGAFEIAAGAGDDLICITRLGDSETGNISAGRGDDTVLVVRGRRSDFTWTALGPGADTFRGGPGWETVWAGVATISEDDGPDDAQDRQTDDISTAGGMDSVVLGDPGTVLADRVDTGAGEDDVTLFATTMTSDAALDLGPGPDEITFAWLTEPMGDWLFDNRTGTGTLDGTQRLQWSSAEIFTLPEPGANAVSFRGSSVAETVWASSFSDIDLGGGDDYFAETYSQTVDGTSTPGALHGGAGRDSYNFDEGGGIDVDLAAGQVRFTDDHLFLPVDLGGIEDVRLQGGYDPVVVRGDEGDNRIEVGGCGARVGAGGGDDVVRAGYVTHCRRSSRAVLRGGTGDDVLVGGETDDRIDGGDGHDRADGREGDDICAAEVRLSCHLP